MRDNMTIKEDVVKILEDNDSLSTKEIVNELKKMEIYVDRTEEDINHSVRSLLAVEKRRGNIVSDYVQDDKRKIQKWSVLNPTKCLHAFSDKYYVFRTIEDLPYELSEKPKKEFTSWNERIDAIVNDSYKRKYDIITEFHIMYIRDFTASASPKSIEYDIATRIRHKVQKGEIECKVTPDGTEWFKRKEVLA